MLDDMEVWQIAEAFGSNESDDGAEPGTPRRGGRASVPSRRDLVRERVLASRGLGPEPTADPPDPDALALAGRLGGLLGGG